MTAPKDDLVEFARSLGIELTPWQEEVLRASSAKDRRAVYFEHPRRVAKARRMREINVIIDELTAPIPHRLEVVYRVAAKYTRPTTTQKQPAAAGATLRRRAAH